MNRRGFLGALFAAPVVAALPDIRRPSFFERVKARVVSTIWRVAQSEDVGQPAKRFGVDPATGLVMVAAAEDVPIERWDIKRDRYGTVVSATCDGVVTYGPAVCIRTPSAI